MYYMYLYTLYLFIIFPRLWKEELIDSKKKNRNPSFLRTLFRMYGTQLICITIILTILEICIRQVKFRSSDWCIYMYRSTALTNNQVLETLIICYYLYFMYNCSIKYISTLLGECKSFNNLEDKNTYYVSLHIVKKLYV